MPSLRDSPGYWIVCILAILAFCGPLLIGLAALSGNGHRWVDILAQFVAPALVVTAIGFVILLVVRLWPAAIVGGLAMLVLFVAVYPQWFPPRGKARPGTPVVTLYSANTHAKNTDAAAIVASIRAARPDIVVLVEVSPQASARLPALLAEYPYMIGPTGPVETRKDVVIASRWPLEPLTYNAMQTNSATTVAQSPLGPLRLVAVHLTRPWPDEFQWAQIIQVTSLAKIVNALPRLSTLVVGDFNSVSSARIGKQVQSAMGVVPAPAWPGTWPGAAPTGLGVTIDQVYRTPDLALLDRHVGTRTGSDHWPVVTRLTLADRR